MIAIEWDERNPPTNPPGYTLTVHTGVSVGLQNTLVSLRMPIERDALPPFYFTDWRPSIVRGTRFEPKIQIAFPTDATRIEKQLGDLQADIAKLDRPVPDSVPELMVYSTDTVRGLLEIVMIWGMVLTGQTAQGTLTGAWYFVVCRLDELEDVLTDVFQIERWFKLEERPARPAAAKRKEEGKRVGSGKGEVEKKRAKIDAVLREIALAGKG